MAWVITRLCRECVDQSCVEVCPVDCIYAYDGSDAESGKPSRVQIQRDGDRRIRVFAKSGETVPDHTH